MNINELVKTCHENAVAKGFYECQECKGTGKNNNPLSDNICHNCNGSGYIKDRNISELLMLIVSELGEAQEALRKNRYANWQMYTQDKDIPKFESINKAKDISDWFDFYFEDNRMNFQAFIKDTFEDEIADVFIRLFDLCGYVNIDIEKHIKAKMKYNETRPKKHNKEF